jgi:hypothetical protein
MSDANYCQCVGQLFDGRKLGQAGEYGIYALVAKGADPGPCIACLNQVKGAHAGNDWAAWPAHPNYYMKCHYTICSELLGKLPALL